jgi:hypothetical protein
MATAMTAASIGLAVAEQIVTAGRAEIAGGLGEQCILRRVAFRRHRGLLVLKHVAEIRLHRSHAARRSEFAALIVGVRMIACAWATCPPKAPSRRTAPTDEA